MKIDASRTAGLSLVLLLLSNDEALANLLRGIVKQPGISVCRASGSELNRKIFSLPNVSLVILDDPVVEEADRSWLLTQIRKQFSGAALIYVAGSHSEKVEKLARTNGAQYYVSKPLEFDRFAQVVQSFLLAQKPYG